MKIADLEHLENVRKSHPTIQGGFIGIEAFASAKAEASNRVFTWSFTYTVAITP
ncbi:hypothetical protein [Crocosphaera chwakensis]|uniref:Uncharacterized protein n=1 Tax=Crocosphaera chwakensis CCY0110 TaxID=391612 RepID=A3IQI9_9CHRO|nr:hypothetical protein [Crocosphaera chwakensis]EAZ91264.1 hypothetical protein CY0110_11592 [Crocosphaera chwakensis CCY0110]